MRGRTSAIGAQRVCGTILAAGLLLLTATAGAPADSLVPLAANCYMHATADVGSLHDADAGWNYAYAEVIDPIFGLTVSGRGQCVNELDGTAWLRVDADAPPGIGASAGSSSGALENTLQIGVTPAHPAGTPLTLHVSVETYCHYMPGDPSNFVLMAGDQVVLDAGYVSGEFDVPVVAGQTLRPIIDVWSPTIGVSFAHVQVDFNVVPEPGAIVLVGAALLVWRRR